MERENRLSLPNDRDIFTKHDKPKDASQAPKVSKININKGLSEEKK